MAALRLQIRTDDLAPSKKYLVFTEDTLDLFRPEFFRFPKAWGDAPGGSKDPKVELRMLHPERPGSSEEYVPMWECSREVRVKAKDATAKGDAVNGKCNWMFPLPQPFIDAMATLDTALRWDLTSREPARVRTKKQAGGRVVFEMKLENRSTAEWAFAHRGCTNMFSEVADSRGLGKRKLADLDDGEYEAFRNELVERVSGPRTKDLEPDDDDKEGRKPWFKSLVLNGSKSDEDSGLPPALILSLKNYKQTVGATKKAGSDEDLDQTVLKHVDLLPDGTWDLHSKRRMTAEEAMPFLMFNSSGKGNEGLPSKPFFFSAKVRWSFKHVWCVGETPKPPVLAAWGRPPNPPC